MRNKCALRMMEVVLPLLWYGDAVSWYTALLLYVVHWWRCDQLFNGVEIHALVPDPTCCRQLRFDV